VRIPFQGQNDIETYENDTKGFTERSSIKEGEAYTHNPSQQWGLKKPKKSDYDKYVEKQKSFNGAKTIGEVNEGGNTFLGGDMKQLNPSETYQKKTTKRKPREEGTVFKTSGFKSENNDTAEASPLGRFAANLLVSDDVLNDGKVRKSVKSKTFHSGYESDNVTGMIDGISHPGNQYSDEGTFSRYYDLDAWWESRIQELPLDVQATYPFLIVPKASKSEKNKGTDEKNFHPTVKPISLMSYLVTLGSREDDLVLDPFVGSGTTCIAAKLLNRKYIGMEMDSEYVVIAQERIKAHKTEAKHDFF